MVQQLTSNGVKTKETPVKDIRFINSNTQAVGLDEMRNGHIIPVFVKDNEQIISHQQLIDTTYEVADDIFGDLDAPALRVSHPVKGRIPSARDKKVADLQPNEKTVYYERLAFLIDIPNITQTVNGQELSLTVGGVRALNQENLYSFKGIEKFKIFIGFKVSVCTNLCISTDGYSDVIRVSSPDELSAKIRELLSGYNMESDLKFYKNMQDYALSEQQFANMIGRAKMYPFLSKADREKVPALQLGEYHFNTVVKEYYKDNHFGRNDDGSIDMWKLYNLFTSANKGSYIDTFLERGVNAFSFTQNIGNALENKTSNWFLN